MILDIFFNNSVDINNKEIYTDSYVKYLISEYIFTNGRSDIDSIFSKLESIYGNMNHSKTTKYINKNFTESNGFYSLSDAQENAYKKTKKFKQDLFYLEWEPEAVLHKKLSAYITQQLISFSEGLPLSLALLFKKEKGNQKIYESMHYDFLLNYNKYIIDVDCTVNTIDASYDQLPLSIVISNSIILELLFANGINTISDLKSLSVDSLLVIFAISYENLITSLAPLKEDFSTTYKSKICDLFNGLKARELEILSLRNGFNGQESMTLEEVGSVFGLTRERCRQIESKAFKKILCKINQVKNILMNLFLSLCTQEMRYISEEKLEEYVAEKKITRYILFLYENCGLDVEYNSDLKVIYNKSLTTLEDICNEVIDVFDDIITVEEFECLSSFEKSVIEFAYKLYKNILYVKKGISTKELIGMTIDEKFPNGYRIGCQEDYELLQTSFNKKYGVADEFPSDRSIVGFLERLDYCQIDKGTYKNRKYCVNLSRDLIEEIINFVLLNKPTVFYSSIYEKYKDKLNEIGVNNYYYLKGLIDPEFPDEFVTKRNYVSIGTEKLSSYDSILQFMKSFNGVFDLNDLRNKFIGVKDYTFQNVIYNESEKGLIQLGAHRYIYISKVVITEDTVKEFKQFIDEIFVLMGTKVISSRKIYARLSLFNKDLLNRLKIVTDSFSTLSLIYHYFKDIYGFNRPLLSLNKDENINQYVLIANYVATLDSFNSKTIKNYTSKMNVRSLYSYLEFMEEQSDNFVQVNLDTMVNKEKFAISESNLKEIEKMLELIFNRFDEIDTRKFNGYSMLPKLTYLWNKYLLVGIIRSFFSEKYEIQNTETTYDSTDFIIRRIK